MQNREKELKNLSIAIDLLLTYVYSRKENISLNLKIIENSANIGNLLELKMSRHVGEEDSQTVDISQLNTEEESKWNWW